MLLEHLFSVRKIMISFLPVLSEYRFQIIEVRHMIIHLGGFVPVFWGSQGEVKIKQIRIK